MGKQSYANIEFTVSGTGVAKAEAALIPKQGIGERGAAKFNGRISRFVGRQAAGGGATTASFYLVHRSQINVTVATLDRLKAPVGILAVTPLTPSATVPFLDTPITARPHFVDSLVLVCDVTAGAGAWTITGHIEIER